MRMILPPEVELCRVRGRGYPTRGAEGAFQLNCAGVWLRVVVSNGMEEGAEGWDHVSVSTADRCPTWEEMKLVKGWFFLPEEWVVQYHPADADYIDNHPYCLHMWHNIRTEFIKPPSIMVGVKSAGRLTDETARALAKQHNVAVPDWK